MGASRAAQRSPNQRRRGGEADGRRSSESPEVSPSRLRSGSQVCRLLTV